MVAEYSRSCTHKREQNQYLINLLQLNTTSSHLIFEVLPFSFSISPFSVEASNLPFTFTPASSLQHQFPTSSTPSPPLITSNLEASPFPSPRSPSPTLQRVQLLVEVLDLVAEVVHLPQLVGGGGAGWGGRRRTGGHRRGTLHETRLLATAEPIGQTRLNTGVLLPLTQLADEREIVITS